MNEAMTNQFNTDQLRGAYAAGMEEGFRKGAETMRRERWRPWKEGDRLPRVGEVIKTLTPSMSGWIGLGRVTDVDTSVVRVLMLSKLTGDPETDQHRKCDLCLHEVAIQEVTHY